MVMVVKRLREDKEKKYGTLHDFACHPCAGAMLIFSVSFQFYYMSHRSGTSFFLRLLSYILND